MCWELECNKHLRPPNWRSVLTPQNPTLRLIPLPMHFTNQPIRENPFMCCKTCGSTKHFDEMCPMNNVKDVTMKDNKSVMNMVMQQDESSTSSSDEDIIDLVSSDEYAYVVIEEEESNYETDELEEFLINIGNIKGKNNPRSWASGIYRKLGEIQINTISDLLENILSLNHKLYYNNELPMFNSTTKLFTRMAVVKLLNDKTIDLHALLLQVYHSMYHTQQSIDIFMNYEIYFHEIGINKGEQLMQQIWDIDKRLRSKRFPKTSKAMKKLILIRGIEMMKELNQTHDTAYMITQEDEEDTDNDSTTLPC